MGDVVIDNVSDTALWVAVYRAQESVRPDALFHDPLAERLAGERGQKIAAQMSGSRYTGWSLVIRTHIIDNLILEQVRDGVDMVINLGAGLDTRPYRLDLPPHLSWIEVDYPRIIQLKNQKLHDQTPRCQLERIEMDLADLPKRREFFSQMNARAKKVLILTEGVTPYLTSEQVASLADDLRQQNHFRFWIADYYAKNMKKHMNSRKRQKQMKNAPFRFFPDDWFGFFSSHGWNARATRYLSEEAEKVGRPFPAPLWARVLWRLSGASPKRRRDALRFAAYVLLEPMLE